MQSSRSSKLPALANPLKLKLRSRYKVPKLFKDESVGDKIRSGSAAKPVQKEMATPKMAETRSNFFASLKTLPLQNRKGIFSDSPSEIYIKECEIRCLNPLPIGFTSDKGSDINLANYSMGDNYAEAFGKSLKNVLQLEKLNLSSNSLSPRGATSILSNLLKQPLKELSLKDNIIDCFNLTPIISLLSKPMPSLRYLNLENTKISDRFVSILSESLANDRILSFLGLAKNGLSYTACKSIKKMLQENHYLKQLDFHWNNAKDIGALLIFEGLAQNDSLKELDLSWNSIGKNKELIVLTKLSQCIPNVQGLAHLDLSFNFFLPKECEILGLGMVKNHEILGIHFAGNQGIIDSQGFVTPQPQTIPSESSHLFFRIFERLKNKNHGITNCWICDGWKEMEFICDPEKVENEDKPIYIHLDCDDYKPDLMSLNSNGLFEISRILPPGEVNFFFTRDNKPILSRGYTSVNLEAPIVKNVSFVKEEAVPLEIKALHRANTIGNTFDMKAPFKTVPRKAKVEVKPPAAKAERIKWKLSKSIFKDYQLLDKKRVLECFEFDWKESKLETWIKSLPDKDSLKYNLKKNYYSIIQTFRSLAAQCGNELLTIGSNVLTDFFNQNLIFDSLFSLGDLGVNWNTVIVIKNRQPYNPANSLVRYEFMELLVRVSYDRYVRSKMCNTISEGFQKFLKEKIGDVLKSTNWNTWRAEHYLIEEVDIILKSHKAILENVYKKYSGRRTLPGQRPSMSCEEFKDLCLDSYLLPPNIAERELEVCFCMAMMVQDDEVYQRKHIEMCFVEFLEGISRVAWLQPTTQKITDDEELVYRDEPVLPKKLEIVLKNLLKICSKNLRDSFVFPTEETYQSYKFKVKK